MLKMLSVGVIISSIALATHATYARSQQLVSLTTHAESDSPPALPAEPEGKTTVLGGEIRNVDPVRDQFSLHIYGQRPMNILFDERTHVYRDGVKVPVLDLRPEEHASVQTILDGANVFAVSIHILSGSPEGDCQGRVLSYNPRIGKLAVASTISPEPVKLHVSANTTIARVGETEFTAVPSGVSDLVAGSLVAVTFESDPTNQNIASEIKVLAVPGAAFAISGNISFLDTHSGILVLVDPRDGKGYQVHFDSSHLPSGENLHIGENATATARYDGARYTATKITINR